MNEPRSEARPTAGSRPKNRRGRRSGLVSSQAKVREIVVRPRLAQLAQTLGPAIDNLDRAEALGGLDSSDTWMTMRVEMTGAPEGGLIVRV